MAPRGPSPGSPVLLLVPTELEERGLADLGGVGPGRALVHLSGFGPVAAAARAAQLLSMLRPSRVVLAGIAGAYDVERHPPGSALVPARVAIDGVGAGSGEAFLAPRELGFPQWPGSADTPAVADAIELSGSRGRGDGVLVTACAASATPGEAARRRERFPGAVAEDMEGFGVALACRLHGLPLAIVRGISNAAGDRDPARWRIADALAAAHRLVVELLDEGPWSDAP